MIHSPDGNFDFFNIDTRLLQRGAFALYLFILCLDYYLQTSIDLIKNSLTLKKKKEARSRWYQTESMIDADYADDFVPHVNTPTQPESLLYNQEQAAGYICLEIHENQIKQSICVLNKKTLSPLSVASL